MQTALLALAACATALNAALVVLLSRSNARAAAERTALSEASAVERSALVEQVRHLSNLAAARSASEAATLERAQRPRPAPNAEPDTVTDSDESTPEWV